MIRTFTFVALALAAASQALADADLRQVGDGSLLTFEQPVGGTAEIVAIGDDSRTTVKQLGRGYGLEIIAAGDHRDNLFVAGGCKSPLGYEPVLIAESGTDNVIFTRCDIR